MGRQGGLDDQDGKRATPRERRVYGKGWPRSGSVRKHADSTAVMQLKGLDMLVWADAMCCAGVGCGSLLLDPPCCTHDVKDRKGREASEGSGVLPS